MMDDIELEITTLDQQEKRIAALEAENARLRALAQALLMDESGKTMNPDDLENLQAYHAPEPEPLSKNKPDDTSWTTLDGRAGYGPGHPNRRLIRICQKRKRQIIRVRKFLMTRLRIFTYAQNGYLLLFIQTKPVTE